MTSYAASAPPPNCRSPPAAPMGRSGPTSRSGPSGPTTALYVRSAYGTGNPWFRRATASGTGRIRVAGLERDVTFTPASELDAEMQAAVDAAYHAKYDRYGPQIVDTVTGPHAAPV